MSARWYVLVSMLWLAGCTPSGGGGGVDARPTIDGAVDGTVEADGAPADATPPPTDGAPDGAPDGDPDSDLADTAPPIDDAAPADAAPADAAPADMGCVEDCGAPPRILTLDANVRRLTEGGQIRLSAVVTDPDGAGDLLGGVLETPDGAPYGPFEAAGDVGTYGFTLTWADIHAITPIDFDGEAPRTLVAAFFDQAGNRTTGTVELTLHCDGLADGGACDGACVSLGSLDHCGACGATCETECRDRACLCPDAGTRCGEVCVDTGNDPANCGGCGQRCDGIADGEGACVGGRCRVVCAPDHRLCDPDDPVCAPCPVEGVARTTCDGRACVAAQCADDFRLCGGACARCPEEDAVETLCLGDRCVASACARGTHPCSEGCCPWRPEVVAPVAPSHGLAADDDGVHVVIGRADRVEHRRFFEGEWSEGAAVVFEPGMRSAAWVDLTRGDDALHAVYAINNASDDGAFDSVVGHLRRGDDGWAEVADFPGERPAFGPAIRAQAGAVWLGYTRLGPHVVESGAGQPITLFEGMGDSVSLALGPDGVVHVAAQEQFGSDLLYARGPVDGEFAAIDPENGRSGGAQPRIATDRDGLPVILHRSGFDSALWVTRFDGRAWRTEPILRGFDANEGLDLIRGVDGRLIGCAGTQLGLHVFYEDDGGWQADEVANGNHVTCRLALGPDGALYVAALGPGGLLLYR